VSLPDQSNIVLVRGGRIFCNITKSFCILHHTIWHVIVMKDINISWEHIPSSKTGDYELSKQFSEDIFSWFLQR